MMPTFVYACRDTAGARLRGELQAEHPDAAVAILRQRGYYVTSLRLRRELAGLRWRRRVDPQDVAVFTHQLAALLSAGGSLLAALQVLREQAETPDLATAIHAVQIDIEAGKRLSQALGAHPQFFSPFYVGMVRAGEIAGSLDTILQRLAFYLEREVTVRQKLRGMLIYPAIVLALAAAVAGVFILLIIPVFDRIYRSAGAALPLLTLLLVEVSRAVRQYAVLLIVIILIGVEALRRQRHRLKPAADRVLLRIPHFGQVFRIVLVDRFVRTLKMMLESGVPVLTGLEATAAAVDHPLMAETIQQISAAIQGGRRISEPMRQSALFPPMVTSMIAIGEHSGTLDEMLGRVADVLDREIEYALRRAMTFVEPLLTLVLGAVVGIILLALYLPIFGLGKAIAR